MQRIFIFLIVITTIANAQSGDVLYCFDFGGAFQDIAPGYTAVSRGYHSPRYLWIDNVEETEYYDSKNPLLKDFVSNDKGEFRLGLDNGSYHITLIMHDAIDRAVAMFKRFLCTPAFAHRIGIMVEDADLPWGKHSLQTWACCSISATGFAGLSVAEMIKPGVVFLRR